MCGTDGFTLQGKQYTKKTCNEKLVELKDTPSDVRASAWLELGDANGGMYFGKFFDRRTCYLKALESKSDSADAWCGLGKAGGGMPGFSYSVGPIQVTAGKWVNQIQSFCYSLELKSANADAWLRLGSAKDIPGQDRIVGGKNFTKANCYEHALGYESELKAAWSGLAKEGGGTVNGIDYSQEACAEKAAPPVTTTVVANTDSSGGANATAMPSIAEDMSSTIQ